jgi:TolB-like protein
MKLPPLESLLPERFRIRLKGVAGIMASVAAVGAALSGLEGYTKTWSALKSAFVRGEGAAAPAGSATVVYKGPTVAVAPFADETGDPSVQSFANGLRRALAADLGKFGQLRVLAPHGAAVVAADELRRLGADYVVEGDVVRNDDGMRATFRLVNVSTGAQVWSKPFDAKTERDSVSTQEEIAGRAAAMIGGWSGQIAFDGYASILAKPLAALAPYECIVQGVMVSQRPLPENYVRARACLETLVAKDAGNADAWGALAAVYNGQRYTGLGLPVEEAASMSKRGYLAERVNAAAARAVTLAPGSAFAHRTLAFAYATQCDRDRVWAEARKAIELNPNDPANYGVLGHAIAAMGDWDAGGALVETGIGMLGPDSPRYWWQAISGRQLIRGENQKAYESALKAYFEMNPQSSLYMAGLLAAIGRPEEAKAEVARLLKVNPGFNLREADSWWRSICVGPERVEQWTGLLRKAGLPE